MAKRGLDSLETEVSLNKRPTPYSSDVDEQVEEAGQVSAASSAAAAAVSSTPRSLASLYPVVSLSTSYATFTDADPVYRCTSARSLVPPPLHAPPRTAVVAPSKFTASSSGGTTADSHDDSTAAVQPPAQPQYSSAALKMMAKAGWTEGKGLGADESGRTAPVEVTDAGGRGLGFAAPAASAGAPRHHVVDVNRFWPHEQRAEWVRDTDPGAQQLPADYDWRAGLSRADEGDPDYNLFSSKDVVQAVFQRKSRFDGIDDKKFLEARRRSNPYEMLGRAIFQNRAALKMANLDKVYNLLAPRDRLLFADICAGPGGFSEYVLWRKRESARGFGFTLRGEDDFQLSRFHPDAPVKNFTPCYGADNTGNILLSSNIKHFANVVAHATGGTGVDFVMADGGFSVEGEENYQEALVRQLVLCQFLTALAILNQGGDFVCKVFDLFTPFSVGLVWILYHHFAAISLIKPVTSRPANSERYVVCKGLRARRPPVVEYLFELNDAFNDGGTKPTACVVEAHMLADRVFVEYIRRSNFALAEKQIEALDDFWKYIEDPSLLPANQSDIRRRCLREWSIPENPNAQGSRRPAPPGPSAAAAAFSSSSSSSFDNRPRKRPGRVVVSGESGAAPAAAAAAAPATTTAIPKLQQTPEMLAALAEAQRRARMRK